MNKLKLLGISDGIDLESFSIRNCDGQSIGQDVNLITAVINKPVWREL